jgi:hypothetical protein
MGIHLIRIPDRNAREQAMDAFLVVRETWMSFRDNVFGVTTEHVQALEKQKIPFQYLSKAPGNGTPASVQS